MGGVKVENIGGIRVAYAVKPNRRFSNLLKIFINVLSKYDNEAIITVVKESKAMIYTKKAELTLTLADNLVAIRLDGATIIYRYKSRKYIEEAFNSALEISLG